MTDDTLPQHVGQACIRAMRAELDTLRQRVRGLTVQNGILRDAVQLTVGERQQLALEARRRPPLGDQALTLEILDAVARGPAVPIAHLRPDAYRLAQALRHDVFVADGAP